MFSSFTFYGPKTRVMHNTRSVETDHKPCLTDPHPPFSLLLLFLLRGLPQCLIYLCSSFSVSASISAGQRWLRCAINVFCDYIQPLYTSPCQYTGGNPTQMTSASALLPTGSSTIQEDIRVPLSTHARLSLTSIG